MKKVVIVGGGYGGVKLLHELKGKFDITLIDEKDHHLHQVFLYEYIALSCNEDDVKFNLNDFCKKHNATFKQGRAVEIDKQNNAIQLENGETIGFDYLAIATGSKTFFVPTIEGASENCKDIKDFESSQKYREKFAHLLQEAKTTPKDIVVIGGGLSGVEIALEMAQKAKKERASLNIKIVEGLSDILNGLNDYIVKSAKKQCEALDVQLLLGEFVKNITPNEVIIGKTTHKKYKSDLTIFVAGVLSEKVFDLETNKHNQIIPDEYFRTKGCENIFVLGDVSEAKDGEILLPSSAHVAQKTASYIAKNIKNLTNKKALQKQNIKPDGVLVALGNKAVGNIFGINISSCIAFAAKKYSSIRHKALFK